MRTLIIAILMLSASTFGTYLIMWDTIAQEVGYTADDIPPCYHVIQHGDTFWGIARSITGPETDIRETVYHIQKANPHLKPGLLQAGDPVLLPGRSCNVDGQ